MKTVYRWTWCSFCATLIFLMLVLPLPAKAVAGGGTFTGPVTMTLQFPGLEVKDNGDGTQGLTMEGYPSRQEPGLPKLPSRVMSIAVPPGTIASSVRIVGQQWQQMPGAYKVAWGQPPLSNQSGDQPLKMQANEEVYSSDAAYPDQASILEGNGDMRAISIAEVRINPVRYYPQSERLEVCTSMTLSIDTATRTMPSPQELAASPFDQSVVAAVDNADQARPWYEQSSGLGAQSLTAPASANLADYMIITTAALAPSVEPFKLYKQSSGMSVQVVTTEWIAANGTGVDLAEKIRNFLKDNYVAMGIDYVLLVGTTASIPMRTCYVETFNLLAPATPNNIPTDYYYSDLSGNWDLNGDGVYGQPGIDDQAGGVDYFPEVYVGRIPSDNATEVGAICQKIVNFSQDSGAWKHKALLLGAVINYFLEYPGILPAYGSAFMEKMKNEVLQPLGFSSTTMYEKGGLAPDGTACTMPLTRENALAELAKGYGILEVDCHGNYSAMGRKVWAVDNGDGVPQAGEMIWPNLLTMQDIAALSNLNLGVVFSCACDNAQPTSSGNLMSTFLQKGAAATIGSTALAYYVAGWSNELMGGGESLVYMLSKNMLMDGLSVGKALRAADVWCRNYCDWTGGVNRANLYDFNLYGDPSMQFEAAGALAISSVSPVSAWNTWPITLSVTGTNFQQGATLTLHMEGQVDRAAMNVVVDSVHHLSCTLDISGAATGKWDVIVKNPDGQQAVLSAGFEVTALCGAGAGNALLMFGLSLGLLSYFCGSVGRRSRLRNKVWI